MYRDQAVGARHSRLLTRDRQDGVGECRVRPLTDQQAFALPCDQQGRGRQDDADDDRRGPVQDRSVKRGGRKGPQRRDENAHQRGAVFEEHDKGGWILAAPEGFIITQPALCRLELAKREQPGCAIDHKGDGQDQVVHRLVLDRLGMKDVVDAFVDRDHGAQGEHQDRDDETPEVELAAIAKRMLDICAPVRPANTIEQ